MSLTSAPGWSGALVTLDMNPHCGVDVVWDMDIRPLPFADEEFDELAAYDVLEHIGKVGDWRGWFDEMAEYWRILKPSGEFGIIVPIGQDAFADPGHTRFFSPQWFAFLDQAYYDQSIAAEHPVTDYRWYWKRSFVMAFVQQIGDHHLAVILKKA